MQNQWYFKQIIIQNYLNLIKNIKEHINWLTSMFPKYFNFHYFNE